MNKRKVFGLTLFIVLLIVLNVLVSNTEIMGDEAGIVTHGFPLVSYTINSWSTGAPPIQNDISMNYLGLLVNSTIAFLVCLPLWIPFKKEGI